MFGADVSDGAPPMFALPVVPFKGAFIQTCQTPKLETKQLVGDWLAMKQTDNLEKHEKCRGKTSN